jgi:hypothetical protein
VSFSGFWRRAKPIASPFLPRFRHATLPRAKPAHKQRNTHKKHSTEPPQPGATFVSRTQHAGARGHARGFAFFVSFPHLGPQRVHFRRQVGPDRRRAKLFQEAGLSVERGKGKQNVNRRATGATQNSGARPHRPVCTATHLASAHAPDMVGVGRGFRKAVECRGCFFFFSANRV